MPALAAIGLYYLCTPDSPVGSQAHCSGNSFMKPYSMQPAPAFSAGVHEARSFIQQRSQMITRNVQQSLDMTLKATLITDFRGSSTRESEYDDNKDAGSFLS